MRGNSHNPSNEADIIEAELFEEEPEFKPACLGDEPFLGKQGPAHQPTTNVIIIIIIILVTVNQC